MKKIFIITLLAFISSIKAQSDTVKVYLKMDNLKPGKAYVFNAKKILGVKSELPDNNQQRTYFKLERGHETMAQGICKAHICKFKTPGRGKYLLTVSHNKRLKKDVSEYLSRKHGKQITSRPLLQRKIKVRINK